MSSWAYSKVYWYLNILGFKTELGWRSLLTGKHVSKLQASSLLLLTTFSRHLSPNGHFGVVNQALLTFLVQKMTAINYRARTWLYVPARERCWAWCPRFGSYSRSSRSAPHGLASGVAASNSHNPSVKLSVSCLKSSFCLHQTKWISPFSSAVLCEIVM